VKLVCWGSIPALSVSVLAAQVPPDLARERSDFAQWLATAPVSPLAAVAQQLIGPGITLGEGETDIPLHRVPSSRVVEERGAAVLIQAGERRALPRGQLIALGAYQVLAGGPPGRTALTVFGSERRPLTPAFFPYDQRFVLTDRITPGSSHTTYRILGEDGIEEQAVEVGTYPVALDSIVQPLRVFRVSDSETGEAELLVYFRDATNGKGSYPAGRFVTLRAMADGRAVLDFNRAHNPFCAYSSVYPCPAPWPGNSLSAAVTAGERYGE
jgi:hypothetical protein